MKPSIVAKLEALYERHEEVQALLGDAATIADQDRFRALSREYAQLGDVARCYTDWRPHFSQRWRRSYLFVVVLAIQ